MRETVAPVSTSIWSCTPFTSICTQREWLGVLLFTLWLTPVAPQLAMLLHFLGCPPSWCLLGEVYHPCQGIFTCLGVSPLSDRPGLDGLSFGNDSSWHLGRYRPEIHALFSHSEYKAFPLWTNLHLVTQKPSKQPSWWPSQPLTFSACLWPLSPCLVWAQWPVLIPAPLAAALTLASRRPHTSLSRRVSSR